MFNSVHMVHIIFGISLLYASNEQAEKYIEMIVQSLEVN